MKIYAYITVLLVLMSCGYLSSYDDIAWFVFWTLFMLTMLIFAKVSLRRCFYFSCFLFYSGLSTVFMTIAAYLDWQSQPSGPLGYSLSYPALLLYFVILIAISSVVLVCKIIRSKQYKINPIALQLAARNFERNHCHPIAQSKDRLNIVNRGLKN